MSNQEFSFISDGFRLDGTIFYPLIKKNKYPAILFVHGWTSERKRSFQYANGLAKLGYISFVFDMRGHGESEGQRDSTTTKEFLDDVLAAYDYLVKVKSVDTNDISAVASSFGCYLASLLTAKRNIKNLVLKAPADYPNSVFNKPTAQNSAESNPDIVSWRSEARKSDETFALDAVSNFNGKILILESEKDDMVPHQTVQNYVNAIKIKSKLTHIVIKDAPHSIQEGRFRDKVEQILVDWFGNSS